jgi:peptidoglycan/LPS O-acetylase OafA/YrhL
MDSARAAFMLVGVFFHAALIYTTTHSWLVAGTESNRVFDYFAYTIHLFRMQGFYVIAGFFAALLIEKKGAKNFLRERMIRLGIPMVTIGFTLNYYMNEFSTAKPVLTTGLEYILKGDWLGHLWFLGNLIIYIAITALLILKKKNTFNTIVDFFVKASKKYFILKFMLICIFFFLVGGFLSTHINNTILFFTISLFFVYLPFYLLGYLFYSNLHTLEMILDYKKLKYHIFASIFILLFMSNTFIFNNDIPSVKIISKIVGTYLSIILCLSSLLLFKSIEALNRSSARVRKLSDASYSIYLLHQPFIVGLFYIFNKQIQNPILGFILISLSTLLITYFIHVYFIQRYQIISLLLNGSAIKTYGKTH